MADIIKFGTSIGINDRLNSILESLECIKDELDHIIEDAEQEGADDEKIENLTFALDALEDSCECMYEALEDE